MTESPSGLLASIVRFSLQFRGVVIGLAVLAFGYGLYSLTRVQYDVFPDFAPPQVVIQTECPGLSPEQVERLVTQPVENAVNGVHRIESLRSTSIQGLSIVTAVFRPGTDIYRARQSIAERLAAIAGQLPADVAVPVIAPLTSSTSTVAVIGLTSKKRSLMDVRTIADWTVKPLLLAVPGVAKVAVFGGDVKELQIQFRSGSLLKYGLSVSELVDAARKATGVRGAGFVETSNQRIIVETRGQLSEPEQLARSVVRSVDGVNLTLGDVAKVVEAPKPAVGAATIMGRPGVQLVVSSQYHANTLAVTREIHRALNQLKPSLEAEGVHLYEDVFEPARFIHTATRNVKSALYIGAALVVIVLLIFLFDARTAAISLAAIPLSLLTAVAVLRYLGASLNTMTLGGLAIAIGEVVDDAVIDVENIVRRLRENRYSAIPRSPFRVVMDASMEVRSAVVYATFSVLLVFVPILSMTGLAGRLFSPLAWAYILAILASLLVALTVTPALCLTLLGRSNLREEASPVVVWLRGRYTRVLNWVERHPLPVVGTVTILTLLGLAMLPFLGGGFLPELKEGHFILHVSEVPGTSLGESIRLGELLTRELLRIPGVRMVAQRVGRAEESDDVWGTHYSEVDIDLEPMRGEESDRVEKRIRGVLRHFAGVKFALKTFLTERIEETLSGYTASVVVDVFGNDLDVLDKQAEKVAAALRGVPGATEVQVQSPQGMPVLVVKLREGAMQRWGIPAVQVLEAIRTAYRGEVVGQVYDGNRIVDVSVILDRQERGSVSDVGKLLLQNPEGVYVPLADLADIRQSHGRYVIRHRGARRVQVVTCNVEGRDVAGFVAEARRSLVKLSWPAGTYFQFSGSATEQAQSRHDLLLHSVLAGLAIVLLLSIVMGNVRNLALVLVNLPFAFVGGVLVVFATGGWLSMGSLVGFVTVFGITLRNSIMLISHYEHLVGHEGVQWGVEAALRGASDRLAPILMTATVTALGLLPLALGPEAPGREVEGPMAQVILGGLITSTTLNLLVLPALALRFGKFEALNRNE